MARLALSWEERGSGSHKTELVLQEWVALHQGHPCLLLHDLFPTLFLHYGINCPALGIMLQRRKID